MTREEKRDFIKSYAKSLKELALVLHQGSTTEDISDELLDDLFVICRETNSLHDRLHQQFLVRDAGKS